VSDAPASQPAARWWQAWPDVLAFAAGLALAWFGQWQTKDLVWSLWLSSLLVGYAMIVWMILSPALFIATKAWPERAMLKDQPVGPFAVGGSLLAVGGLFLLGFFTLHFGGFHYVHAAFLNMFFPMAPGKAQGPGLALFGQVFAAYWPFVLVATVAERQAFRWPDGFRRVSDTSATAAAIAARKARSSGLGGMDGMMTPYKNVIRLHLLIFFFAFASIVHLQGFAVYTAVYAVYFFPWRLLRKPPEATDASPAQG
jgi:hypothetical protein